MVVGWPRDPLCRGQRPHHGTRPPNYCQAYLLPREEDLVRLTVVEAAMDQAAMPVWLLDVDGVLNVTKPGWGGPPRQGEVTYAGVKSR